jgi:CBS domain-containing protein
MATKLVRDLMVPLGEYPSIPQNYTLHQAIQAMGKVQILKKMQTSLPRTALVFDEAHTELLGILRRRDIMRGLEPRFLVSGSLETQRQLFSVEIDSDLSELSFETAITRMRERSKRLVREYMLPIRTTINADDHLMKAMFEMVSKNVSLLPVLDGESVIGVLRSVEVLYEIALVIAEK